MVAQSLLLVAGTVSIHRIDEVSIALVINLLVISTRIFKNAAQNDFKFFSDKLPIVSKQRHSTTDTNQATPSNIENENIYERTVPKYW